MQTKENLVGKTVNRIYVIKQVNRPENDKYKKASKTDWYECRCTCKEDNPSFITSGNSLRKGYVKSCGCLRREMAAEQIKINRKAMIENGNTTRPKSRTKMIEFNGKTQSLTDWAKEIGITKEALSDRLRKHWSLKDALTIKKGEKKDATKETNQHHEH